MRRELEGSKDHGGVREENSRDQRGTALAVNYTNPPTGPDSFFYIYFFTAMASSCAMKIRDK